MWDEYEVPSLSDVGSPIQSCFFFRRAMGRSDEELRVAEGCFFKLCLAENRWVLPVLGFFVDRKGVFKGRKATKPLGGVESFPRDLKYHLMNS